jgi:hypothetical protein
MIACATRCRALELSRCFITQSWFQSCFSKSVTAKAKANVVYWKGLAAWLDRGRPLKSFYRVWGGKVSRSRAPIPQPFYFATPVGRSSTECKLTRYDAARA